MSERTYRFNVVTACEMCGAAPDRFGMLGMRLNRSQGRDPRSVPGVAVSIFRCDACGLVFPDPQPVPEKLSDHYDMSPDEYWGDERATGTLADSDLIVLRNLRARFPSEGRPRALDVGTGTGSMMRGMEAEGFEAHGFEPAVQFLDVAKAVTGLPDDRFRLAGIEDADYPDATFDLINFGAVLEHFYHPGQALERAMRWLRPGGRMYAEVPSSRHLVARLINRYFRLRGTNYVTNTSPMHSPFHLYEFDVRSFEKHGARVGYTVEQVDFHVCDIINIPRPLHPVLRPIMRATGTGLQMTVILQRR